jgi:DNA-directed RNA polymerase subunit RPC12/RpoP
MNTRRRRNFTTDYRSVLNSRGDITIGAYARVQRRRNILIGAVGVGLVGVALWLHILFQPDRDSAADGRPSVLVQCVAPECNYRTRVRVGPGETFPLACPQCKQRSSQKLWQCRDCGRLFLPKGVPEALACPSCGSARVGTATDEEQVEAGAPSE